MSNKPPAIANLFRDFPDGTSGESVETLLSHARLRIERIVSHGEASPEGFWYDQEEDEWVALLKGGATLEFEGGESVDLKPGDWLNIPARRRHRVAATDAESETVWLAVHYAG